MMRKIQSKKIQSTNTNVQSQKLLLAKNYLEQQLEIQGYDGHVKYDQTNKALVQYRVKEGTVAVLRDGKLSIFKMPMKKFRGALPVEVQSVDMDSIQTQKATCCKRCHEWKKTANITRCQCGGYLVNRKRFSIDTVESWDEEFLEIEFAKKDIRAAVKIDRILSNRPKRYDPTGITPMLAGMSSADVINSHSEELLLIPSGDDVKTVIVKPILSCSLIFVAAISNQDNPVTDSEKLEILKEYNLEPVSDDAKDRQFDSETKAFIHHTTPILSAEMIDSWNHSASRRQSKVYRRKANSLERKYDDDC